ncbi:trypsin-like peptidase domain-containing protein [Tundrisphaera lichenicola]|uniref:trypsin-like peptidase domain-containing protein n=1 Tax=Tundrisphaera lichenicola TaxID=2029860 RepID=UPI003EBFC65A
MSSLIVRHRALIRLLSLILAIPGGSVALGQTEAEGLSASFRQAARRVLPSVVSVRPIGQPNAFEPTPGLNFGLVPSAPRPVPREPGGSGVVIDADRGLVLTNDHVIQGASRVVLTLSNGRERAVTQIWRDPKSDLALLQVDPTGLVPSTWGDSDSMDTGDWVLAIGQPFGLSGTVTAGIVSGKGRGIGIALYEDLIQTDAAINPGNSGGPLVNLKGEIVGINTAIKTLGGGYEGVGFAVPASRARRVASDLAQFGRVRRAYLGVSIRPVDPATADRLGSTGATMITGVAVASPAADAGLQGGDAILKVDGQPVTGPGPLQALIEVAEVGKPLGLTIDRNGQVIEVSVIPEPQPDRLSLPAGGPAPGGININVPGAQIVVPGPNLNIGPPTTVPVDPEPSLNATPPPAATSPDPGPPGTVNPPVIRSQPLPPEGPNPLPEAFETAVRTPTRFPDLGLRLSEPTPALIRKFRLDLATDGLFVTGIEPDGPADRGGLEIGMVITDAAGRKVNSLVAFREALANRPAGRDLLIRILKGTKAEFRVLVDRSEQPEPAKQPAESLPLEGPDAGPTER